MASITVTSPAAGLSAPSSVAACDGVPRRSGWAMNIVGTP